MTPAQKKRLKRTAPFGNLDEQNRWYAERSREERWRAETNAIDDRRALERALRKPALGQEARA